MFPNEAETGAASKLSYGVLYFLTGTACFLLIAGLIALAGAKHIDPRVVLFELLMVWFAFLGLEAIRKKRSGESPPPPAE